MSQKTKRVEVMLNHVSTLAEFIQYSLLEGTNPLNTESIELDPGFERFQRELQSLGFRFDIKQKKY